MQIKDRNTEFPNRRRLEVEEIEYNEDGNKKPPGGLKFFWHGPFSSPF